MLWIALGLFAASLGFGVVLVLRRWEGREVPLRLTLGHGVPAGVGLVLAFFPVSESPLSELADVGLILLALTAVGGLALLVWQLRKGRFSLPLALIHGLVGVVGFLLLLLWTVTRPPF